jgi:hypothetical protein
MSGTTGSNCGGQSLKGERAKAGAVKRAGLQLWGFLNQPNAVKRPRGLIS